MTKLILITVALIIVALILACPMRVPPPRTQEDTTFPIVGTELTPEQREFWQANKDCLE